MAKQGNVIVDSAEVIRGRVGLELPLRSIHRDTRRMDTELLGKAWLDMEQVAALPPGMKLIYQYWGKTTMLVNASNHTQKVSIPIGSIISDKIGRQSYGGAEIALFLESAMSSNPYFLDACLTTVFTIHAVCLPELESVLFCYCRYSYLDYRFLLAARPEVAATPPPRFPHKNL